jgi:Nuclease-related domain
MIIIGVLVGLGSLGLFIRGVSLRTENPAALHLAEILSRALDNRYTFIRNISRRGLGYIDAVLVGPPGALIYRIVEQSGAYLNESADWLESVNGAPYRLSNKLKPTREVVDDVYALRDFLAKQGLSNVPVYAIVVFTARDVQIQARQPVVPIARLDTMMQAMKSDFMRADRVDQQSVEATVKAIYAE